MTTTFEDALYLALSSDQVLGAMLAVFDDGSGPRPAIFERVIPDDGSPLWISSQYPRIAYEVTRQGDWTRTVTGTLTLTVLCRTDSAATPEQIKDQLYLDLHGAAFHPDDEPVIFCQFRSAQAFDLGGTTAERGDQYIGLQLTYALSGFPVQSTITPSPIVALGTWSTVAYPTVATDPALYTPSDAAPALYWHPVSEIIDFSDRGTLQTIVTWYRVSVRGSVLAPDVTQRSYWAEQIARTLAAAREIALDDGSPLEFTRVAYDPQAESTAGQVIVEGWVGSEVAGPYDSDPFIEEYGLYLQTSPDTNPQEVPH